LCGGSEGGCKCTTRGKEVGWSAANQRTWKHDYNVSLQRYKEAGEASTPMGGGKENTNGVNELTPPPSIKKKRTGQGLRGGANGLQKNDWNAPESLLGCWGNVMSVKGHIKERGPHIRWKSPNEGSVETAAWGRASTQRGRGGWGFF